MNDILECVTIIVMLRYHQQIDVNILILMVAHTHIQK